MTERDDAILPEVLLAGSSGPDRERLKTVLRAGDLRIRLDDENWKAHVFKGSSDPSIVLYPLQRSDGSLRSNARELLTEGPGIVPIEESQQIIASLREIKHPIIIPDGTPWHEPQRRLLLEMDPIPALKTLLQRDPKIRMFRIASTPKLHRRNAFWSLVTTAEEERVSWSEIRKRSHFPWTDVTKGLSTSFVARFVLGPLVARNQPLAAAFTTARGAQIIGVAEHSYIRPQSLGNWPVASDVVNLGGSGTGIYRTRFQNYEAGLAEQLLHVLVDGANRLLERLTDPTYWILEDHHIDILERNIAWSSVLFGLDALSQIGKEWDPESLWASFRALTMLEGIWGQVKLQSVLHPDMVLTNAVSRLAPIFYREWAEDIVRNYTGELRKVDPSGDLEGSLNVIADIRHVLHGVGVNSAAQRGRRLRALRAIRDCNLQLINEIAVFWWMSIIMSPETNCIPGRPPWQNES
ncbi:MAG: hypothetical protein WBW04_09750 [Nitrolancea sp.]